MPKNYPLAVWDASEPKTGQFVGFYSKGHHAAQEFVERVAAEFDVSIPASEVFQQYAGFVPSIGMMFSGLRWRGSFPVTGWDLPPYHHGSLDAYRVKGETDA